MLFDNLFTSRSLLAQLKDRGVRATGKVRENRLDKCPVTERKEMAKSRRGSYEQRFDRTSDVLLVRWHDNRSARGGAFPAPRRPRRRRGGWERAPGGSFWVGIVSQKVFGILA